MKRCFIKELRVACTFTTQVWDEDKSITVNELFRQFSHAFYEVPFVIEVRRKVFYLRTLHNNQRQKANGLTIKPLRLHYVTLNWNSELWSTQCATC